MPIATYLNTMEALFEGAPSMAYIEGLWRINLENINNMPPDKKALLVVAGSKMRAHFAALPPEAEDTWVDDFMSSVPKSSS